MIAGTSSAAFDSVDDVVGSMCNRQGQNQPNLPFQSNPRAQQEQKGVSPLRMDRGGQQPLHKSHSRSMPPPPNRQSGVENRANHSSTPTQHRTPFGTLPQAQGYNNTGGTNTERSTPSRQQPPAHREAPEIDPAMIIGLKVGRGKLFILFVPLDPQKHHAPYIYIFATS